MPLVRITLSHHHDATTQDRISNAIHQALMTAFNVPADDHFHIFELKEPGQIRYPASYLGVNHTDDILFIQIIAAAGRKTEQKRMLYRLIADNIAASTAIRKQDTIITLTENNKENWSFGNGDLQQFGHV